MRRFAPRIELRVSREAFIFTDGASSVSISTYLYLQPTAHGPRILAVGEQLAEASTLIRVELFGDSTSPSPSARIGRMQCLEAFIRYGIQKVVGRRTMVKPIVTVFGLTALEADLHGYQAAVLWHALDASGAVEIHFPELSGAV